MLHNQVVRIPRCEELAVGDEFFKEQSEFKNLYVTVNHLRDGIS